MKTATQGTSRNTNTDTTTAHEGNANNPSNANVDGWLSFDRYVDALWSLEYTANNSTEDDELGDGSNRIVRTQPFGAPIRVSVLAVVERSDASTATNSWRATMMFRYWGSSDALGRDDHKSFLTFSGNNLRHLRSSVSSAFAVLQHYNTVANTLVTPLRYVSVRESGAQLAYALESVGLQMTAHNTGQVITADELRPRKKSVFSRMHQ